MFSLKSLLFAVAIAGLGTAGLIHRSQHWASALIALTLGILLFGVCRAWYGSKSTTFWGPFALVGGVYLAIVSLQPLADLHYNLPTTQLVVYGLERLQKPIPTQTASYTFTQPTLTPVPVPPIGTSGTPVLPPPTTYYVQQPVAIGRETLFAMATTRSSGDGFAAEARAFLLVAQCLWCLLLATVAGIACSWTVRRRNASVKPALGTDAG